MNEPSLTNGSNENGVATVTVELAVGDDVVLIERKLYAATRTSTCRMRAPGEPALKPSRARDVAAFLASVGIDMALERRFVMAQGYV